MGYIERGGFMGKTKSGSQIVNVTIQDGCPECHFKQTPRDENELRLLQNRLHRMIGQLNGVSRMLEENRYCGEVLTQIAAIESALQSFGYEVLKSHMESCVVEEIKKGNTGVIGETVDLIKKLK